MEKSIVNNLFEKAVICVSSLASLREIFTTIIAICDKIAIAQFTSKRRTQTKIKAKPRPNIFMLKTLLATVRQGKIEISEPVALPEGTKVLVTLLPNDESQFWNDASEESLNKIWDNSEDNIYAELLEE